MPEEIRPEIIQRTQKTLGKYVKKPPLTEKLLSKPPFRFLHDILNTVIKETGFLKGLFTDEELNSENVKEREAKVAFLNKLINAVKTITKTNLSVRPSKIVAGLEPTETNLLLQAIGKAIEKKLDSSDYVKHLKEGQIVNNDKKKTKKSTEKTSEKSNKKPSFKPVITINKNEEPKTVPKLKEIKKSTSIETPKSTDRNKTKTTPRGSNKNDKSKEAMVKSKGKVTEKASKTKDTQNQAIGKIDSHQPQPVNNAVINENVVNNSNEEKLNDVTDIIKSNLEEAPINLNEPTNNKINNEITTEKANSSNNETKPINEELSSSSNNNNSDKKHNSASIIRPKSARPKSGELKEIAKSQNTVKEATIPLELNHSVQQQQQQQRPKSSLRPPSVRPSSARPGAPRLRPDSALPTAKEVVTLGKINVIVENFDKDADDEETVVIQNAPEIVVDNNFTSQNVVDEIGENKGHLVEQILEQINDSEEVTKPKIDIEDGVHSTSTSKDIGQLRSLIQTLTKTANPLGKLMNYLHEDIDAMHSELELWTNTKKQLFREISKQKKISEEMNKPLLLQLENLNQEIKKQEQEIINARNNILRNEIRIKELLIK